jgi:uncharacterized membrane protein YccC
VAQRRIAQKGIIGTRLPRNYTFTITAVTTTTAANAAPSPARIVLDTLREERGAWLFVARTAIALYLTGWLAMRFALPQPGTAMMTVVIVANRQTGMVLAKSFYRVIGTLSGAAVALFLVGVFPQERMFLLPALAMWIGLCAGGALMFRNFASYSFVLAGYTAMIVAVPAIANPLRDFDSATARVSEVLLGIVVAGVVSDTIFPTRLRDALLHTARTQFQHFMRFITGASQGAADAKTVEQAYLRSMRESIALEDLRSSVIFEDPATRARNEQLQTFNHRFMEASTSLQSLHHLLDRLRRIGSHRAVAELTAQYRLLGEALNVPDADYIAPLLLPRLEELRPRLVEQGERACSTLAEESIDFQTGHVLILRLVDELQRYARAALSLRAPRIERPHGRMRFVRSNDVAGSLVAGVRGMLTVLVAGLFWIESAWPSGVGVMVTAGIFASIFASSPDPVRSALQLLTGWASGLVVSFFALFFILNQTNGYELLVAATLPLFLPSVYLLTRPTLAGIGTGYAMGLVSNIGFANTMNFDVAYFLNDGIGQIVGVGVATLAFLLIPSHTGSGWFRHRQLARLRGQIALAADAPLAGLLQRFESVMRDLIQQIIARTTQGDAGGAGPLAWGLAVHETGRALIELRQAAAGLAPPLAAPVADAVKSLAHFYEHPGAQRYTMTNRSITTAIAAIQAAQPASQLDPVLVHLHLLRLAMLDAASVVAQYRPADENAQENPHAA